MLKLSKAGKMPCRSWSLQAGKTCPASFDTFGELVAACEGCYAKEGNYRFDNVKASREHNFYDWRRVDWVDDMVEELDNDRWFRWFDSGDCYHLKLAAKIYQVMKLTPWINHWLPTRMHKIAKFKPILAKMSKLPNVVIRHSSDGVNGEMLTEFEQSSTIIPSFDHWLTRLAERSGGEMVICESSKRAGKCGPCRACWSKDVSVVAYIGHGQKMKKIQREVSA